MTDPTLEELRYPLGPLDLEPAAAPPREERIEHVETLPVVLRSAVAGLIDAQLDTPYRPGGWTVRQVVHHVADSHINAVPRFRLPLTEDEPTVGVYQEKLWAELEDARSLPLEPSLRLLEGLHTRMTALLRSLSDDDFQRPLRHPDLGRLTVDQVLTVYAWHGHHHAAHITGLRERQGW